MGRITSRFRRNYWLAVSRSRGRAMKLKTTVGRLCRALVRWQERRVERESAVLWRSLNHLPSVPWIPGVEVVTMDRHHREQDLTDIYNEACAGTPGFHRAGPVQLEAFKASPYHDPKGVFLARIEGTAVGYCFARLTPGGLGKITGLAVLSGYRRRGIGRALVLSALHYLREKGATRVRLLVDPEDPAQALYESLGFSEWKPVEESQLLAALVPAGR
jgi:mycothiol synthase